MTSRPGTHVRLPRRGTKVAQERHDHARQEQVDEGEEQDPDGPQDEQEPVHQSTARGTSTTRTVSPTSIRSPIPRTTSVTGVPLTRDPFVLPRSE